MSLWAVAEWDYAGSQQDELDEVASVFSHEAMNPFRSQNNSPALPTLSSKPISSNATNVLQQLEEAEHMEDEYQQLLQQQQQHQLAENQRLASTQQPTTTATTTTMTSGGDDPFFQPITHSSPHTSEIRAPAASRPESMVPNSIAFVDEPEGIVAMPPHWTVITIEGQEGERYFYNVVTNETSWDPPEGTIFAHGGELDKQQPGRQHQHQHQHHDIMDRAAETRTLINNEAAALDTPTSYSAATLDPLPAGWSSAQDDAGREYFFNEITGETTWDRPRSARHSVHPVISPDHHSAGQEGVSNHAGEDDHKRVSNARSSASLNVPKRQTSSDENMLQSQILHLSLTEFELQMLQLDHLPSDQIERRGPLRVKTQKTSSNATISSWKDYYVVVYLGYLLLYRDDNGLIKQAYAGLSAAGGTGGSGGGTTAVGGGGKGSNAGSGSNDSLAPPHLQQKQLSTSSSTHHGTSGSNNKHAQATRAKPSGCFDADKLLIELSTKEKALTKKKNCFCVTPFGSHVRLLLQDTTASSTESNKLWVFDIQASLTKRRAGEAAGLEDSQLTQLLRRQTSGAQDASSTLKMNKKIEQSDHKMLMLAEKEKDKEKDKEKEKEKDKEKDKDKDRDKDKERSRTSGIRNIVAHGIQRRRSTQDERLRMPPEDLTTQQSSQPLSSQQQQQQQQQQPQHPGSPTSPHQHHGQEEETEGLFGRPLLSNRKSSRDRTTQRMSSSGLLSSFKSSSTSSNNSNSSSAHGATSPQHGSQELISEDTHSYPQQPHQIQDQSQRQKSPGPQRALSPTQSQVTSNSTGSSPVVGTSAAQNAKARLSNMSRNFFSKDKDKEKEKDRLKEQQQRDKEKEKEKSHSKDDQLSKKDKKDDKEKDFRQKVKEKVKARMDKDRKDKDKDKAAKKDLKSTSPLTSAIGSGGSSSGAVATNSGVPIVFGGYLTVEHQQTIPKVVELCVMAIEKRGLSTAGIYRVSGHMGSIQNLKRAFNDGLDVDKMVAKEGDINTIAALLKLYFRELKEPLMMFELYPQFIAAADISEYNEKLYFIKELVHSLPEPNFSTLKYLMMHLGRVQDHYQYTKMDSANLAICFAPNLLRQEVDDLTSIINTGKQSSIVDTLIEQREWIFDPYPADDDEEEGGAEAVEAEEEGGNVGDDADSHLKEDEDEASGSLVQEHTLSLSPQQEVAEHFHMSTWHGHHHQQQHNQSDRQHSGVHLEYEYEDAEDHSEEDAARTQEDLLSATPASSSLSPPPLPLRHSPSGPFSDSHREDPEEGYFQYQGMHSHLQPQLQQQQQQYTLAPRAQYVYEEDDVYVANKEVDPIDNDEDDDDDDDDDDFVDAHDEDGDDGRAMLQTNNHPPQLPARRVAH
ncbi:hypothetical protein DFQ26_003489 [Actinomortierella ambigua]|nr:hypothetical protein DFQ26_003489 [Actinomortierella ambigua]